MKKSLNIAFLGLLPLGALAMFATSAMAAAVSFIDGTFNDANWTPTKFIDTTPGASASFSAGQVATGGNPGSYRNTDMTFGGGVIGVSHLSLASTYNPTTHGAISTIDFFYDLLETNPPFPSAAVNYNLLLVQGGVKYGGKLFVDNITTHPSWTLFSHPSLTASDFGDYTSSGAFGTASPDFSTNGGLIQFGYVTKNSSSSTVTTHSGIDNWSVTVHTAPEPSTLAMMLGSVGMIAGFRRFARKRSAISQTASPVQAGEAVCVRHSSNCQK